jgi:hypothetical protein
MSAELEENIIERNGSGLFYVTVPRLTSLYTVRKMKKAIELTS